METKKTQQESEQMVKRKLSPPFLIKMTSGEYNHHCDLYNHGSYHIVRKCAEGFKWVDGRVDTIPQGYDFKIVEEKPETKLCPKCTNDFDLEWPFLFHDGVDMCIRCYERYANFNREKYREALRKELKYELLQTVATGGNNKEERVS